MECHKYGSICSVFSHIPIDSSHGPNMVSHKVQTRARSLFELLPDSVHSNAVAVELSITRRTKRAEISNRRSLAHWSDGFRSQIYVATTDEKMHVFHLKGKRVSTLKTPALVTQLEVLQARYRNF